MILFGGDPHGKFDPIIEHSLRLRPTAVVLLGDQEAACPLDEELADLVDAGIAIYFISGNHDRDRIELWTNLHGGPAAEWCIDSKIVTLADGTRIAGLGGCFMGRIWYPSTNPKPIYETRTDFMRSTGPRSAIGAKWRAPYEQTAGLPLYYRHAIWPEDYKRLAKLRADILVCHEAPSCFSPGGFAALDELAQAMRVSLIVHGHHHTDYLDTLPNGIRVIGVGLAGVRDETGTIHERGRVSLGRRMKND